MDPWIFFAVLTTLYLVLYFFDTLFKSCMLHPYLRFLEKANLSVNFMRVRWQTTAFNRALLRWSNGSSSTSRVRSWLLKSFTAGAILSFLLLPVGVILLVSTIFGTAKAKHPGASATAVQVEILLPGVNLPLQEVGYYITTLLFSTIVHEFGHALAAVLEDVSVTGFGLQIYYCIPLAFTEINADQLNSLKWFRKLRILCAGIWHNFIFAILCYLLLSSMPYLLSSVYTLNQSVIVTSISKHSPLRSSGDSGLNEQDIITHINDCGVTNENTWRSCLLLALRHKPRYCISSEFIRLNDESIEFSHHDDVYQCCDAKNVKACCFEYIDDVNNNSPLEIPQHVCLDVRRALTEAHGFCNMDNSCSSGFCLRALISNSTTIFQMKRTNHAHKALKDVIYVGHPGDVVHSVSVSSFVPKHPRILPSYWGETFTLFLKYNIVFSFGLALVNAIPCFGFDGHYIIGTIINRFLVNRVVERPKRDVIVCAVTCIGTVIFALAIIKVLWVSAFIT